MVVKSYTRDTELLFLDIMENKEGKKVFMDIYSKPTDSKRYVLSNKIISCNAGKIYHFLLFVEFV